MLISQEEEEKKINLLRSWIIFIFLSR